MNGKRLACPAAGMGAIRAVCGWLANGILVVV
jgi:hypothetical protein